MGCYSFCLLNFMDAYSCYNQIRMNSVHAPKIASMTYKNNNYYEVMSFDLKNVGAMYQRLMDMVLSSREGINLEVYVDDAWPTIPRHLAKNKSKEKKRISPLLPFLSEKEENTFLFFELS